MSLPARIASRAVSAPRSQVGSWTPNFCRERQARAACADRHRAQRLFFSTSRAYASAKPTSAPKPAASGTERPVITLEESGLSSPHAQAEGETRDFRPPWFYRFTKLSMFAAIPGIAFYSIFFYNWGETEHVFSEPQRWKARLLGEPEPHFKPAVLTRTLPRSAFSGAEDDANREALLAAADEQIRAEIEAAHKEAMAAIEGTEASAPAPK